jgi:hypothetical protein
MALLPYLLNNTLSFLLLLLWLCQMYFIPVNLKLVFLCRVFYPGKL